MQHQQSQQQQIINTKPADRKDNNIVLQPDGIIIKPAVDPIQRKTFGARRECASLDHIEISFLILAVVEITASLAFVAWKIDATLISNYNDDSCITDEDFILAIVLTINIIFCLVYVINGIFTEKPYELIFFLIANLIVICYVIVNYFYRCLYTTTTNITKSSSEIEAATANYCTDGFKLARLIVTLLLTPPVFVLGVILARNYIGRSDFIFRLVGASVLMQNACKTLFAAMSIIKLDLQLQLSMLIVIVDNYKNNTIGQTEILILSIGIPFSIIWAVGSYFSIRLENRKMWIFVVLTSLVEPAYNCYRIYIACLQVFNHHQQGLLNFITLVIGNIALATRAVHLFLLYKCYRNFGRGLVKKVFDD